MTAGKLPGVSGPQSLTCSSRVKQGRGRPRRGPAMWRFVETMQMLASGSVPSWCHPDSGLLA